jgi:ketosteroid isomerase-like protein
MRRKHGGRVKAVATTTTSEQARRNVDVILEFFGSYLIDKPHFYSLWVADEPSVITPFVTEDVAVCGSATRTGWDEVRGFFDPIHDEMHGKFDWTINEFLIGEDPNVIVTKSGSDIDVTTGVVWGNKTLAYKGRYVQIFKFADGRIKSFEEYYDTAFLNAVYSA